MKYYCSHCVELPAQKWQIAEGIKVKCIAQYHDRYGKTGVIKQVVGKRKDCTYPFEIIWDDGHIGNTLWGSASAFTILPPLADFATSVPTLTEVVAPTPAPVIELPKCQACQRGTSSLQDGYCCACLHTTTRCAGCGEQFGEADTKYSSNLYGGREDLDLCVSCATHEEDIIDKLGTNDVPNLLQTYVMDLQ